MLKKLVFTDNCNICILVELKKVDKIDDNKLHHITIAINNSKAVESNFILQ